MAAGPRPLRGGRASRSADRPPVSWALVFAGLLAGGALSFGAGVITGTQMTAVAYRGDLPASPSRNPSPSRSPSPSPGAEAPATQAEASRERTAPRPDGPRDRQVAAAGHPAETRPFQTGTGDTSDPSMAGKALVDLPRRDHWSGADRPQSAAGPSAASPGAPSATAAPPPPLPKPGGTAPQPLTPMGAPDAVSPRGDDARLQAAFGPVDAPLWRIAAPAVTTPRLGSSANWQAAPRRASTPRLPPPIPPARADASGSDRPASATHASPQASGYSVQVGAYRDRTNARAQAARLSAAGYAPRIVHAQATQSRLYMVRLGAFPDRPAAETFARQIAQALDIDTLPVAN